MFDDLDVVFIDMCNYYEYEVGYFENVLEILVDIFCDQLLKVVEMMQDYKDKKIVMYCIGGICCEKVSVWMKYNGFNKVWYIEGGIIEYVCCVCEQGLLVCFIGKNFVFDEWMGEWIFNDVIVYCYQCGVLCDIYINCLNDGCYLLFIQCLSCVEKFVGCCSEVCMEEYKLLEEEQCKLCVGCENGNKIFNKFCGWLNIKFGIFDLELLEKL